MQWRFSNGRMSYVEAVTTMAKTFSWSADRQQTPVVDFEAAELDLQFMWQVPVRSQGPLPRNRSVFCFAHCPWRSR